jgi:hypothetical protein
MAAPTTATQVAQSSVALIHIWFVSCPGIDSLAGISLVFPGWLMMQVLSAGPLGGGISSDQEGVNGHDRIVCACQENLESEATLPTFIQTHLAAANNRVTVAVGRPFPHETQDHLVISIPTVPAGERASRIAARVRQIADSVSA